MRDNRLAATLIKQGRDVLLIPLYTPVRTDEVDVSERRVYYGGINVFMQHGSRLFRRIPWFLDRWLDKPALLRRVERLAGGTRPRSLGPLTVSVLKGESGALHKELNKLLAGLRSIGPTLVNLPNLMFVGIARAVKDALDVAVVCTLAGEDIFLDALKEPYRTEAFKLVREGAGAVDGFIAPTAYYASYAAEHFGIDRRRVHVVPMGIDVEDITELANPDPDCNRAPGAFTIGYLARICEEKGVHELAKGFVRLRKSGRDVHLRVAGYLSREDKPYWDGVHAYLDDSGVGDAAEYVGEVTRAQKLAFLQTLHVLSVPTVYDEAKGFYVLEAMACGVPVVQPRRGAFPELVAATGGGILYDQGRDDALADALAGLMDDSSLRRRLAADGARSVRESFTDKIMAEKTWALYEQLV
jgi:glycosyltransferase involved in cell wall biosynthesis